MAEAPTRRGLPFVVSSPSGAGKTTLCRAVVDRDPQIVHSISYTTRKRRSGERDGVHYHFVGRAEFRRMGEAQAFVEFADYGGNLYGTGAAALDEALASGKDVLLEIEIQGARQIRQRRPDARLIFLLPPSRSELERRLRGRGTDSDEVIERRLASSRSELEEMSWFDYLVMNDDLETAIGEVREILGGERAGERAALVTRFGREAVLKRLGGRFDILP